MPQAFVKIINRDTYTNVRKAQQYVDRGLAAIVSASPAGQLLQIRMLDSSELAMQRSHVHRADELWDIMVADSCSVRVWKNMHSGPAPMAGGPEYKVKQFVNPPTLPPRETL